MTFIPPRVTIFPQPLIPPYQLQTIYYTIPLPQPPLPIARQWYYNPTIQQPIYYAPPITLPPPHLTPAGTIQTIKHELIHGVLTPVTHYHFNPPASATARGYNPIHGFDTGALPPGWGGNPEADIAEPGLGTKPTQDPPTPAPAPEPAVANIANNTAQAATVAPSNDSGSVGQNAGTEGVLGANGDGEGDASGAGNATDAGAQDASTGNGNDRVGLRVRFQISSLSVATV